MHPGSDTVGRNKYNTYRDIYAWDNGQCGFADRGTSTGAEEANNVYDNIQGWDNGKYGISITHQKSGVLSNSFSHENGNKGLLLYYTENINVTNVIVRNNNSTDTASVNGINVEHSDGAKFTSCQSYDDRETPLQRFGIGIYGTNTGMSLLNFTAD